jgi:3,4-dihydroxy-2-butanone 4-phosphate synthase
VLGHVDGVATVLELRDGDSVVFEIDPSLARYVVEKGSIALDGVSLTVAAIDGDSVTVALIPETRRSTTLGFVTIGSRVNVEVDILAKHVEKLVRGVSTPCTAAEECAGTRSRTTTVNLPFSTIEEAIEEIRMGRMVVVCDDEDRENEGDVVMAAQFVTPEAINFMAKEARGWICLALTGERCEELGLDLMTAHNESPHGTPFTVTIEAREGVTTGVSAHDRAHTIQVAIDPRSGADDLVQPGHVNPLKAKAGGVLERTGHTEASVDLARLAGLNPAGVICEVMNDDGEMARVPTSRSTASATA